MAEQNARLPSREIMSGLSPASSVAKKDVVGSAASAAAKPARKQKNKPAPPEMKDGLRELVETVVFVVVLVLLLKAFVAEAFVIPTGSMAETLYGYQKLVICPKCQYQFPVNCSCEVDPQQGPPTPVVGCTCPNCRYHIDFATEGIDPAWHTGDRVLVAKFLYDLGVLGMDMPKRHDVVVFKYPMEPQKGHVPMNYIKRLIGLPGETIAIYYGKLYVLDDLHYDDSQVPPLQLWEKDHMHTDDPEAQRLFHAGKFHMIRKTPQQMLAVRRLVFDNDHQPKDLIGKAPPRWTAEKGAAWKADDSKTPKRFEHSVVGQASQPDISSHQAETPGSGRQNADIAWLRYRHLMPDGNRQGARPELITDFMGYNTWEERRGNHLSPGQDWVGDLMLECEVQVEQAQGDLILELSKGVDRFQARWDLATGMCTLVRLADGRETKLESKETTLKKPGKYRLRFADFDEQLTVWVDSSLPFGDGVIYPEPAQRGPTQENDLQPASIGIRGSAVAVARLKIWRDTYYTVYINAGDASGPIDFGQPADWEPLRNLPVRTMYVQPNHFLCLGDNSRESSDGRSWGTVPKRLLLGRALMIYYPLTSRAGRIE